MAGPLKVFFAASHTFTAKKRPLFNVGVYKCASFHEKPCFEITMVFFSENIFQGKYISGEICSSKAFSEFV